MIQGANFRQILHHPLSKQHVFALKKKTEGESAPAPEKQSLSHFQYGNSTKLGPAGQFLSSLYSSGSVGLWTGTTTLDSSGSVAPGQV